MRLAPRLLEVATPRGGVFSGAEAIAEGARRQQIQRAVRAGQLIRVVGDVYRIAGCPETWQQWLHVLLLWLGAGTAASHRCAAILWGLLRHIQPVAEVVTMRRVKVPKGLPVIVHWIEDLPAEHVRIRSGFPCTSVERTLLELCGVSIPLGRHAFDDAIRRRLTTRERLDDLLYEFGRSGRNGTRQFRLMVDGLFAGNTFHSSLERGIYGLLTDAGMPPITQYPVVVGGRTFYIDLAYPEEKVAVEAIGYEVHTDREQWEYDARRHSLLASVGWRLILVTRDRYQRDPLSIVREVRGARQRFSA